jgi:hypothetical protein
MKFTNRDRFYWARADTATSLARLGRRKNAGESRHQVRAEGLAATLDLDDQAKLDERVKLLFRTVDHLQRLRRFGRTVMRKLQDLP